MSWLKIRCYPSWYINSVWVISCDDCYRPVCFYRFCGKTCPDYKDDISIDQEFYEECKFSLFLSHELFY